MRSGNLAGLPSSAWKAVAWCCAAILCAFVGNGATGADGDPPASGLNAPYGIDTTFGDGGVVRIAMRTASQPGRFPQAAGVDTRGRIVVLVEVVDDPFWNATNLLLRLLPDGRLDPAFGDAGRVHLDSDDLGLFAHLAIDPSDRIILVRRGGGYPARVEARRFDATGQPDLAFGVNGRATIPAPDQLAYWGTTPVTTDAAGDVLVAFTQFTAPPVRATIRVARWTPSGQLDTTFGENGAALLPAAYSNWPTSIAVDPAERIVVGGGVDYFNDFPDVPTEPVSPRVVLGRFLADGKLDPTFKNANNASVDPRYGFTPGEAGRISFDAAGNVLVATQDGLRMFAADSGSSGPVAAERVYGLAVGDRGYVGWIPRANSDGVFVHRDVFGYVKSTIPGPAVVRQTLRLPGGSVVAVGASDDLGDVELLVVKLTPGGVSGGPELRVSFEEMPVSRLPRARFVRGSFNVANTGGAAVRTTARLFLSDNPLGLDPTATKLRSVRVGRIAAGASKSVRFRAAIPRGASATGPLYILVQVDATRALRQAWRLDDVAVSYPIEYE